jgi:hypothetical protein
MSVMIDKVADAIRQAEWTHVNKPPCPSFWQEVGIDNQNYYRKIATAAMEALNVLPPAISSPKHELWKACIDLRTAHGDDMNRKDAVALFDAIVGYVDSVRKSP